MEEEKVGKERDGRRQRGRWKERERAKENPFSCRDRLERLDTWVEGKVG